MKRPFLLILFFIIICLVSYYYSKRWDILSDDEQITLRDVLAHWETWVPEKKKEGTAPLITFEEIYAGLNPEQIKFLDRIRSINPRKSFGFSTGGGPASGGRENNFRNPQEKIEFKRLDDQWMNKKGQREKLDPQYLPQNVYEAYEAMMQAMKNDLGKRLLVESGYRSPAYQLYTFLFYLPKHHYSLVETGHWVALPGYSEHGAPKQQAIDFINEEAVNGEDNPAEFEALPEYEWLLRRAGEFGFELSYPKGKKGITFEPWHWRYRPTTSKN